MKSDFKKLLIKTGAFTTIGFIVLAIGGVLSDFNNFLSGVLIMLLAIGMYFYIVFGIAEKNWLDLRAVFSGIWLGTIGLAALRLTGYQEEWQTKTWVLLGVTYLVFHIASLLAEIFGDGITDKLSDVICKIKFKKIGFANRENRLFLICVVTTLVGLGCFIANIAIKGYIPCFSNDPFAYVNFYTKFHLFAVGSTIACGLCYYCIKTQKISKFKKVILWLCILYLLILYPIMIVSRGVFVSVALYFTTVVFYLNKRKFTALVLCLVIIFAVYIGASQLRNFTDAQLGDLFEPVEVEIVDPDDEDEDEDGKSNVPAITLSPKAAFLYGYLTVGHDNFNEAVQNLDEYTWGCRTFRPFNVILRIPKFEKIAKSAKDHLVRPHLNTFNFLGEFYYDFHTFGVIFFVFILAFLSMLLQRATLKYNSMVLLLILGLIFQEIFLVFFSNMAARFEFWMFLGLILIFAVVSSIVFSLNKAKKSNS